MSVHLRFCGLPAEVVVRFVYYMHLVVQPLVLHTLICRYSLAFGDTAVAQHLEKQIKDIQAHRRLIDVESSNHAWRAYIIY